MWFYILAEVTKGGNNGKGGAGGAIVIIALVFIVIWAFAPTNKK